VRLGAVILGFLAGCAGDTRWEIAFEAGADRERTAAVEAVVLAGGCDGARTVAAFRLRPSGGDDAEDLAPPPGRYGLAAVAHDDACMELASGCAEIELPGEAVVTVTLGSTSSPRYACAGRVCAASECGRGPGIAECSRSGTLPALGAGGAHACALSSSCGLFCWGNAEAIPGAPTGGDALSAIPIAETARFRQVTAGGEHTCTLRDDGVALCAGRGDRGQLGRGDARDGAELGRVSGAERFAAIAAGEAHTCGITRAASLACWGAAGPWLGRSSASDVLEPSDVGSSARFAVVAAGARHTCAIDAAGTLLCFGDNADGQIGLGDAVSSTDAPTALGGDCWASVAAGRAHTCAITCAGALHCWGGAERAPVRVGDASDWRSVSAGGDRTCGVRADGTSWCWERGAVPLQVTASAGWAAIAAGDGFTCAREEQGAVFCWGENARGQLGTGDTAPRDTPSPVR
jgi:hypothetical protein